MFASNWLNSHLEEIGSISEKKSAPLSMNSAFSLYIDLVLPFEGLSAPLN